MKKNEENFFRQHQAFFLCIVIILAIFTSYWVYEYHAKRPLRDMKEIPIRALNYTAYKFICPVAFCGTECPRTEMNSIQLWKQIPGAFTGEFLYDLGKQDIILHIIWLVPTFRGGQFDYYYEVSSPEVKADLLKFIEEHKEDLHNHDLQSALAYMLREHKAELTKIGDGDPFVGLERAGAADWIREGKDPEVEWQKKYPSKNP